MHAGFRSFCSSKLETYKDSPFSKSIMDMDCLLEASSKTKPKQISDGFFKTDKAEIQLL